MKGRETEIQYWVTRGYSEDESKEIIKEKQFIYANKSSEKTKGNKSRTITQFRYWMKQINPTTNEFYTEKEAKDKVSDIQTKRGNKIRELVLDDDWLKNNRPNYKEYWMNKGYSKSEAIEFADKYIQFLSEKMKKQRNDNPTMNLTSKSSMSNTFIDLLIKSLNLKKEMVYGGSNYNEYVIYLNSDERKELNVKFLSCDFKYKNLIIEIYGDYWHANPKIYNADENPISFYPTRRAIDIWEYDKKRKSILESKGFKVIEIWENDIKNNKTEIVALIEKEIKNAN